MKEIINRVQAIDHLIRIRGTGPPSRLARHLSISERSLYELIRLMKSMGAPIGYDKFRRSYYYLEEGRFDFSFNRHSADSWNGSACSPFPCFHLSFVHTKYNSFDDKKICIASTIRPVDSAAWNREFACVGRPAGYCPQHPVSIYCFAERTWGSHWVRPIDIYFLLRWQGHFQFRL